MSSHDKKQEEKEHILFDMAFSLAEKKGGETRSIMRYLHGDYINREKNDSPDMVYECIKGTANKKRVTVGIEHFRVDQLSCKKSNKRISKSAEIENHLAQIYEDGHSELERGPSLSNETKNHLLDQLSNLIKEESDKTYLELISDLSYSIDKHLKNAEKYRSAINKIAQGGKTDLVFFIELHAHFQQFILNHNNIETKNELGKLVFFRELTDEIEKAFSHGVDYIIILYDGSRSEKFSDIVAIHRGNIEDQLRRQNQLIYKYVGLDDEKHFSNTSVSWDETASGNYRIITSTNMFDNDKALEKICSMLHIVFKCQKRNIPFATTNSIQCIWKAFAPYLDGFEEKDGIVQPILKIGCEQKVIEYLASL